MVAAQYFPVRLEVDTQEGEIVYAGPAVQTCELMGALHLVRRSLQHTGVDSNDVLTLQAANIVPRESWTVTVERPQRSFPCLQMSSE
jgi:hypothetical protein